MELLLGAPSARDRERRDENRTTTPLKEVEGAGQTVAVERKAVLDGEVLNCLFQVRSGRERLAVEMRVGDPRENPRVRARLDEMERPRPRSGRCLSLYGPSRAGPSKYVLRIHGRP